MTVRTITRNCWGDAHESRRNGRRWNDDESDGGGGDDDDDDDKGTTKTVNRRQTAEPVVQKVCFIKTEIQLNYLRTGLDLKGRTGALSPVLVGWCQITN